MRDTPNRKYSNKYCHFHRDRGHDTKECFQLKDEIQRLIHQGYLKEFATLKSQKKRPWLVAPKEQAIRSRSRSHDRNYNRSRKPLPTGHENGRAGIQDNNRPRRGVINTIAGVPIGRDSMNSRRRHVRNLSSCKERVFKPVVTPCV